MPTCGNCDYDCCCKCPRDRAYYKNDRKGGRCWYCDIVTCTRGVDMTEQSRKNMNLSNLHMSYDRSLYTRFSKTRCSLVYNHRSKYVCWDCRVVWRSNRYTEDGRDISLLEGKHHGNYCKFCQQQAEEVNFLMRFPKAKDRKRWNLLFVVMHTDFSKAPKNSLGAYWQRHGKIGCTLHLKNDHRKLFWIPKHARLIPEWKKYMIETKFSVE
jgi:hypothetical protein